MELKSLSEVSDERTSPFKKSDKLLVYFVQPEGSLPEMVFSPCHPGNLNSRTLQINSMKERYLLEKMGKIHRNIREH